MPRTRSSRPAPQPQPIQAAAYPLVPKRGQDSFEANRIIDIMLQGDSKHDTELSWYFYQRIPELRYIARYVANSLSQARLFVGRVTADPYNPERVGPKHPAKDILEGFAGGFEGQSELLDRLGLHLTIAGDSILAGPKDNTDDHDPPWDAWRVYSSAEMTSRNGVIFHRTPTGREEEVPGSVLPVRVWRQHPKYWYRADSPVLSSFTVLREIDLLDQHVHASAVSRLAGAGLLLLPDDITFPVDETELDGIEVDPFIRHLTEVMSIAIKNRDSAAAMVPIMLRGPGEAIGQVKHLTFSTPFDDKVPDLRNVALRRLALGMDVPPEVLLGMSESTQWSAWQTDESTVRLHTVPLLQLIAGAITVGWFRPTLRKLRLPASIEADIDNLVIWFDISNLRVRPNVTEEAQAMYDRFEVDGSVMRLTAGLTEQDKPSKQELAEQILLHLVRNNETLAGYAINALREKNLVDLPEAPDTAQAAINTPQAGTNPDQTDIIGPRSTPGERSQDKQTAPPPVPDPNNPDPNNNEVR